jgi:hypothetical protein
MAAIPRPIPGFPPITDGVRLSLGSAFLASTYFENIQMVITHEKDFITCHFYLTVECHKAGNQIACFLDFQMKTLGQQIDMLSLNKISSVIIKKITLTILLQYKTLNYNYKKLY